MNELQTLALTHCGLFTSFRVEDGQVRGLRVHLGRLNQDCQTLFRVPLDADYLRALIRRAMPQQGTATVRVTVFVPAIDLGHSATADDPHFLVTQRRPAALLLAQLTVRTRSGRELKGGVFTPPFGRATPHLFNDASSTMLDENTGFRCISRNMSGG